MNATQINVAVRKACREITINSQGDKVARALEILGVVREKAQNYGLACYDTKSVNKSVTCFFNA